MRTFGAGFLTAAALAVGAWVFWLRPEPVPEAPVAVVAPAAEPEAAADAPRKRGRGRRAAGSAQPGPGGVIDDRGVSDDLTPSAHAMDFEGAGDAAEGLTPAQLEGTIDANWNRIQRCIYVDAAGRGEPATGTVNLGIRIRPDGSVAAVSADAPAALRTGELLPCLRTTVAALRFPAFQGREMVVRYPIRIE